MCISNYLDLGRLTPEGDFSVAFCVNDKPVTLEGFLIFYMVSEMTSLPCCGTQKACAEAISLALPITCPMFSDENKMVGDAYPPAWDDVAATDNLQS